jgi:apolipoprotein N-acyltransferase
MATLSEEVAPLRVRTLYKRCGDLFAYACVLFALAALLWSALRKPVPRLPAGRRFE